MHEVYTSLLQGLQERKNLIMLTGEAGTGKTTLLRKLMDDLAETAAIAFVYHTTLTFEEILTVACEEVDLPTVEGGAEQKIQLLTDFAIAQSLLGKNVVLLLDEAQNLQEAVLEQLTSLLAPTDQAASPLQLVLAGQPELEVKLQSPRLHQLQQAIALSCRLDRLPEHEVGFFIRHRLHTAGSEQPDLFSPQAIQRVALHSEGIPRVINVLCDNALQIAQTHTRQTVSAGIVEMAAKRVRLQTAVQPVDLAEPDTAFLADGEPEVSLGNGSTWLTTTMPPWSAFALGIVLVSLVGLVLYQASIPQEPLTLVTPTPEKGQEELSGEEPLAEHSAALSPEAQLPVVETFTAFVVKDPASQKETAPSSSDTSAPPLDTSAPPLDISAPPLPAAQGALSSTAAVDVNESAAQQEWKVIPPTTPFYTQLLLTPQKTRSTASHKSESQPPGTVAALARQTSTEKLSPQRARPHRPLSDDEHALFQTVLDGDHEGVVRLLAVGVSPNVKSRGGWTPLMWAVIDGRMAIIQTLLHKGASVNVSNNRGMTPLMYAAWNGYADILQLFLDQGANVQTRDKNGATALQYVRDPIAQSTRKAERPRIERLLTNAIAKL
jgi:type II secretory pathway predicted ATPase ExeA